MSQDNNSHNVTGFVKLINTRWLMISSAVFMGLAGLMISFLPQEILSFYSIEVNESFVAILQITGALYLGFAILNWMARGNIIGGIYSRPVALGNFLHFFMVSLTLLKQIVGSIPTATTITVTVIYSTFAICFGYILFAGGQPAADSC